MIIYLILLIKHLNGRYENTSKLNQNVWITINVCSSWAITTFFSVILFFRVDAMLIKHTKINVTSKKKIS